MFYADDLKKMKRYFYMLLAIRTFFLLRKLFLLLSAVALAYWFIIPDYKIKKRLVVWFVQIAFLIASIACSSTAKWLTEKTLEQKSILDNVL